MNKALFIFLCSVCFSSSLFAATNCDDDLNGKLPPPIFQKAIDVLNVFTSPVPVNHTDGNGAQRSGVLVVERSEKGVRSLNFDTNGPGMHLFSTADQQISFQKLDDGAFDSLTRESKSPALSEMTTAGDVASIVRVVYLNDGQFSGPDRVQVILGYNRDQKLVRVTLLTLQMNKGTREWDPVSTNRFTLK